MTTNGQQMAGDYFTTTANVMSEMFSQETEEWDALRANAVAYNEMLRTQLNTLDNTIRQYGTITDAQRNQVRQSEWELVRAQGSRDTRRLAAQRRAARTIGNAGEDVREQARKAMAGEGGDTMGLAEIINPDMNSDQMLEVMRNRINENTTMGRFFGDTFIAGEGGGGQATDTVRIFAGMGILDNLRRMNDSSGLGLDDNQMRDLSARTVGLEGGHLLSQSIYNSQQGMITSQAMSSIESTENPSEWLKVMEANAPGWGFTPEILATAARMGSHEERRAELQTELDTRLAEQQGQNRGEEIEAAFRERVGPIGSGQKYGSGLIGAMRRRRAGQSRRATTERLRNASQEQRILMGSMGEAREMVLTSGSDAARDGSSWDAARGLEVMARGNGIASNEKLVELAAGMSNGDNEARNEILRNYMYLRQLSQSGTQLNTPEVQGERIDEALRRATDRLGEEYSQTDAARVDQATTAVAQRNVHGPVTKTGSEGWAEYSLHENGIISYTDPDGRSRRVPRGDPQYSRLLAITNGEDPGPSGENASNNAAAEGADGVASTPEEGAGTSPGPNPFKNTMTAVWSDPARGERSAPPEEAPAPPTDQREPRTSFQMNKDLRDAIDRDRASGGGVVERDLAIRGIEEEVGGGYRVPMVGLGVGNVDPEAYFAETEERATQTQARADQQERSELGRQRNRDTQAQRRRDEADAAAARSRAVQAHRARVERERVEALGAPDTIYDATLLSAAN